MHHYSNNKNLNEQLSPETLFIINAGKKHLCTNTPAATEKQLPVRGRFIAAHRFTQGIVANPALKVIYDKKANGKCSAYSKAVSEYMLGYRV